MMKTIAIAWSIGLLLGCKADRSVKAPPRDKTPAPVSQTMEPGPKDAGQPVEPVEPEPPPTPTPPATSSNEDELDAAVPEELADDAADAGSPVDASGALGPAGVLRSLSIRLSGMDDNTQRFMQFRVIAPSNEFAVMGVIHEGLRSGTFRFDLPHSLRADQTYRLDFWVDTDMSGGYNRPPTDHAWSLPIPNGADDVVIDFAHNTDFTDIEQMAPISDRSLILSASDMGMYMRLLIDVRLTERASGRLAGRQIREIPGDTFDVVVGSVAHEGLDYQIDVAIDADDNGDYDPRVDPSWRLTSVATATGVRVDLTTTADRVDVGF